MFYCRLDDRLDLPLNGQTLTKEASRDPPTGTAMSRLGLFLINVQISWAHERGVVSYSMTVWWWQHWDTALDSMSWTIPAFRLSVKHGHTHAFYENKVNANKEAQV